MQVARKIVPFDNLHNGLNLDLGKSFTAAGKSMLKYGKDSRAKFTDFVYICITRGKSYYFAAKTVTFSARVHKHIQILQTSQGYIFRILQRFATKLCSFTSFMMSYQVVVKELTFLAKIKF